MKLNQYLTGYLEVELISSSVEKLINTGLYRGLNLWHIKRLDGDRVSLKVPLVSIWSFIQLVRQHKGKMRIIARVGVPFWVNRVKKRKGMLLGVALFFVIVYMSLSFVWSYEVVGNERFSDKQLIAMAQSYGLLPGASLKNFDYDDIQRQMVRDNVGLSFVKLTPKGTQIEIRVTEKPQVEVEDQSPANLVAKHDGVIKELLVFKGTSRVSLDQKVRAGDCLIAGVEYGERTKNALGIYEASGKPEIIRAKGVVYGEVDYSAVGMCGLQETVLEETNQVEKQVALVKGEQKWVLIGPKEPVYENSRQLINTKNLLSWQDYHSPFSLVSTSFYEQVAVEKTYTLEEAYYESVKRARAKLAMDLAKGSTFVREDVVMITQSNPQMVQVKVTWTVLENLATTELITNNSSRKG